MGAPTDWSEDDLEVQEARAADRAVTAATDAGADAELLAAIARGATPPRRFRTALQQKVAELVDSAVDDLLMNLEGLLHGDVTDALVGEALGMEHVDLGDAWVDWCEQEDR